MKRYLKHALAAAFVVLTMATTACSGIDVQAQSAKTITIAEVSGYDDDVAVTRLWKHLLEQKGYTVEIQNLDLGAGFAGMARGDIDAYMAVWLPATHSVYMKQYQDQLHVIKPSYYDNDRMVLAVPDSVDEQTISDVAANPGTYGGRIVGIEPGSGEMEILRNDVMPKYGMDEFNLVDGSTPAMLAALKKAANAKQPTVAALWTPHWAFDTLPIRPLEDDKGAWPKPDGSHVVVSKQFTSEHAQVAEWFSNTRFTDDQLTSLMAAVHSAENPDAGVEKWLAENQDVVASWTKG